MRRSWLVGVLLAPVVVLGLILHFRGIGGFVTHPVSLLALAGGGLLVSFVAERSPRRTKGWLFCLAASLALYAAVGVWASAQPSVAPVALWSVAWVPPTVLISIVGVAAAGARRVAWGLALLASIVVIAAAVVTEPVEPFDGLSTAAPDAWDERVPGVGGVLVAILGAAMVGAVVFVAVRALRAAVTERRQLLTCAAVTAAGPGLVIVCMALAVLHQPGEVDPATGSVAYLATIAIAVLLAGYATLTFDIWAIRTMIAAWTLAAAVLAGVGLMAVVEVNAALGAVLIVIVTLGLAAAGVGLMVAAERWSRPVVLEAVAGRVPGLSPRENEVLARVANGATNASVAAELFLSERTVEQHLRAVFSKLGLGDHEGSNRRVRAAAIWWRHSSKGAEPGGPVAGRDVA